MQKIIWVACLWGMLFLFCDKPSTPIQGAWKMVYQKFSSQDTTVVFTSKDFPNPQIKIFTKSHFAYGYHTSEGDAYGGGEYTLNGNKYSEIARYTINTGFLNRPLNFTVEIKNDTLYQSGFLDSTSTEQLLEKYVRSE